jgi:precorrin-8X/cobalt-precorrin-8 methylmutase
MPLFDAYVMVDWSGSNRRRAGRQDCIWIAHGPSTANVPTTVSPPSRTEAEHFMRAQLQPIVAAKRGRVLLCADFGYGYPAGFASLLANRVSDALPPWRIVWQYLSKHVQDDLGAKPGQQPTNRSNRFEVASAINAAVSNPSFPGPFWCQFKPGVYAYIPQKQPPQPFADTNGAISPLRITDRRAKSNTPFRLFGNGSVGSQVLTGIPRLHAIRFDPQFTKCSAVWPFETGWAPRSGRWLDAAIRILHAEIYPSVRMPLNDKIKDRGQVRAMWHWARDLDRRNLLAKEFAIPSGIKSGSAEDHLIRSEEGWILVAWVKSQFSIARPGPKSALRFRQTRAPTPLTRVILSAIVLC